MFCPSLVKLNNQESFIKKMPGTKKSLEEKDDTSSIDEEHATNKVKNASVKEDFTKLALEYRKKFYEFHRAIERYASTVNNFAAELKKQLTIKVQKILDHRALADNFERQLYKLARNPKQTRKNWSEEETLFLISLVAYYSYYQNFDYSCFDEVSWKFIAEIYPGKKADQLRLRWHNVFKVTLSKAPWSPFEDDMLFQIVQEKGPQHWKEIAVELNARSEIGVFRQGKQCRERWINHLDPSIKKGGWSDEEDIKILTNFMEVGKKWAEIAKRLGGRTENGVKNRWISLIKRHKSEVNLDGTSGQDELEDDNWALKIAQAIISSNHYKKIGTDKAFVAESEKIESVNYESEKKEIEMKNEESSGEKKTETGKKIMNEKAIFNKSDLLIVEEQATPKDKKSELKAGAKPEAQKVVKNKPVKNEEIFKNLEDAEFSKSKRPLLNDRKLIQCQQFQQYPPQSLAQSQPKIPQIINRRSLPLITPSPYNFFPERFNSTHQMLAEEIYYKEEQQYPDPSKYSLNLDRHLPANMRVNRGVPVPDLADSKATRITDQYQNTDYMKSIDGILQQANASAYEQEDEAWIPDIDNSAPINDFANKSKIEIPYGANSEDPDPHRYLLTERSLGNGKQLERVIEQQPNTLYFAVVNTQSKDIYFIDSVTKRNYDKTLRIIKEEHVEEANVPMFQKAKKRF